MVDAGNIRTLRADWGTRDEAIGKLMDKLQGSRQIPLLAVFPASRPNNPVVLKTWYTQATLISKLNEAGGSKVAEVAKRKTPAQVDADADVVLSKLP